MSTQLSIYGLIEGGPDTHQFLQADKVLFDESALSLFTGDAQTINPDRVNFSENQLDLVLSSTFFGGINTDKVVFKENSSVEFELGTQLSPIGYIEGAYRLNPVNLNTAINHTIITDNIQFKENKLPPGFIPRYPFEASTFAEFTFDYSITFGIDQFINPDKIEVKENLLGLVAGNNQIINTDKVEVKENPLTLINEQVFLATDVLQVKENPLTLVVTNDTVQTISADKVTIKEPRVSLIDQDNLLRGSNRGCSVRESNRNVSTR